MLSYIFWPNPQATTYDNPKVLALLALCGLMIALGFAISFWRKQKGNPVTRRLTRSWPAACIWFGGIGLVLLIARVEQISYISMRVWWMVWAAALLLYVYVQFRRWRMMHYEVLPTHRMSDPREKYLPKRKK
jgi:hypothetical protein